MADGPRPKEKKLPNIFLKLPYFIVSHPAYLTLPFSTQAILLDMFSKLQRATCYGTTELDSEGFAYGFAHCSVSISRSAFQTATRRIKNRGFFNKNRHFIGRGIVPKWAPSNSFRTYQPSEAERLILCELRNRNMRQERSDQQQTWLDFGHEGVDLPPHPMILFWSQSPIHMSLFHPSLPIDQDIEIQEGAHAYGTQEPIPFGTSGSKSIGEILQKTGLSG